MKKKKKPDAIVFDDKTQEYHSKILPYASGVGAPRITPPDVTSWKNTNIVTANHQFKSRYDSIKEAYQKLMEQYEYNNLVYNAKFNFEPVTGKTYYLYKARDESTFLSLISPDECSFNHLGSFKLGPDKMWEKL